MDLYLTITMILLGVSLIPLAADAGISMAALFTHCQQSETTKRFMHRLRLCGALLWAMGGTVWLAWMWSRMG